jgi:putative membrane protein
MNTTLPQSRLPEIEQPNQKLLTYYILSSLLTLPAVVIVLPLLWIRFHTLRYRLEESGIRMNVGLLFRKEVVVAFRRIQDIHVSHNIVQRWLGISNVSIQTASGNAMPEIIVEGVTDANALRDWLYERMRGAKSPEGNLQRSLSARNSEPVSTAQQIPSPASTTDEEVTSLLRGIRDNLAAMVDKNSERTGATR